MIVARLLIGTAILLWIAGGILFLIQDDWWGVLRCASGIVVMSVILLTIEEIADALRARWTNFVVESYFRTTDNGQKRLLLWRPYCWGVRQHTREFEFASNECLICGKQLPRHRPDDDT